MLFFYTYNANCTNSNCVFLSLCHIAFSTPLSYNIKCKAEKNLLQKEVRKLKEMTNQQFDTFLETLAELIEAKATTIQEAVQIIRDKKSK